jgi:hypothetical protein
LKAKKDSIDRQVTSTKLKVVGILVLPLFYLGVYLTISAIEIYRETIINWTIPLLIWLTSGFCILPFTYSFLKEPGKKSYATWQLLYNCITFGGIMFYLVMTLNFNFTSYRISRQKIKIKEKGHLSNFRSCGNPYTRVIINGNDKELIFDCGTNIDKSTNVVLTIKNGLFGFDIITNKILTDE